MAAAGGPAAPPRPRRRVGLMVGLRLAGLLLALWPLPGRAARRRRPCTELVTEDCEAGRFAPCGTREAEGSLRLASDDHADCLGPGNQARRDYHYYY